MRTTPLIGKRAWFGPRRFGWGLSPVSTEGWIATLAFVILAKWIAANEASRDQGKRIRAIAIASFLVLVVLKGTSPGGTKARREFDSQAKG